MAARRAHALERRKDRRIPVVARVRIEPVAGGSVLQADLVDVSAGGLRASLGETAGIATGAEVQVEITVQDGPDARHPPLVNLSGRGRIVRVESTATALAFDGALTLREPFAQMLLL
jgi:c-di-GMP-binding flagellar brake protein YcgR